MLFTKFLCEKIPYLGFELAPHWVAKRTRHFGSAVVAFRGICDVKTEEMVDLEDRQQSFHIRAEEMLHFIGEWFEGDLDLAIARQRLFISGFAETLQAHLSPEIAAKVKRQGNDLYVGESKLSVSIVTASPVSTLFHFGVNINAAGAPVNAIGLNDLKVNPDLIAEAVLSLWSQEWSSMAKARCKVAPR